MALAENMETEDAAPVDRARSRQVAAAAAPRVAPSVLPTAQELYAELEREYPVVVAELAK